MSTIMVRGTTVNVFTKSFGSQPVSVFWYVAFKITVLHVLYNISVNLKVRYNINIARHIVPQSHFQSCDRKGESWWRIHFSVQLQSLFFAIILRSQYYCFFPQYFYFYSNNEEAGIRERVRLGIQRLLVRAHCVPLFFFQQYSPVGIYIFTDEDPQSEWMKRDESNRVYWFQTRFLSLVYM